MAKKITFTRPCSNSGDARIGGGALIGDLAGWPVAPDARPLTLVMSLPTRFLNEHAGFHLPADWFISVFSYYAEREYFLDSITYHGSEEELAWLRKGYTKVLLHGPGEEQFGPITVPAMAIDVENTSVDIPMYGGGSSVGDRPSLLQAEPLDLGEQQFALQLYGGKFPRPYNGIFGLSDAVGYLFIDPSATASAKPSDAGTFFVQVT